MKKELIVALGALSLIAIGSLCVNKSCPSKNVTLGQIKTDKAVKYPYVASMNRSWAVEMVFNK